MRRSKFMESQIVAALKKVDGGVPSDEEIRKHTVGRPRPFSGSRSTAA